MATGCPAKDVGGTSAEFSLRHRQELGYRFWLVVTPHTIYRKPLQHLKEDHEVIFIKIFLKITHPAEERMATTSGSTVSLLFSNNGMGSFTSDKNQVSESAVRRNLRYFVLIRED